MHPKIVYDCSTGSVRSQIEFMWQARESEYLLYVYRAADEKSLARRIAHVEEMWDHYSSPWWLENDGEDR